MKLICKQSELNSNLSLTSRAVPVKPTHSILANILLEADADTQKISLTAFDLGLGIRTTFAAAILEGGVTEGGRVAVPAKLFSEIVSKLPDESIALSVETSNECPIIKLKPKTGQYEIRGMVADDFPELPNIDKAQIISLKISALIEGLKGSLFASSTDEIKQVLTGVHLMARQDVLEFAATDGHRLAVVQTVNENAETINLDVTLPSRALRELEKMLSMNKSEDLVAFKIDQGQVVFELPNQRLTSRTLEGQYPAYNQLIPRQFQKKVTLDRKHLLTSLDRISVLAEQKNNLVKITTNQKSQEITLSCESQDVGNAIESIPGQILGEDIILAFNIKYLKEGLKALPTQEVLMQINQPLTPVVFSPIGGANMTYLAMPVQLKE